MPLRNMNQDVTHWVATRDGFGAFTWGAPVALRGRWEDKRMQFRDPSGDEKQSQAIVYFDGSLTVVAAVDIKDYLFLGTSAGVDPTTVDGAYPVKQFEDIPDLRALRKLRRVFL